MTTPVISLQADWQKASMLNLPAVIAPWLLEEASLTAKLKRHSQLFQLQVLHESMQPVPAFLTALFPDTPDNSSALLREVLLSCDNQPCVYAQSWLPKTTLASLQPLANMGQRPLGDYIFRQENLLRGEIEACQVDISLPQVASGQSQLCWARRSVFQLQQQPFLVAEVFLPAIARLKQNSSSLAIAK
ncbi:chorismate--pyruvate lyase family protein [Rheinheimera sp. WS51]|uniref:chorismate--pyruvate lyase family protein n=1 Tax=Rheinheimera sp. WS51 TaxID=3425886 RepID=UPI003D948A3E